MVKNAKRAFSLVLALVMAFGCMSAGLLAMQAAAEYTPALVKEYNGHIYARYDTTMTWQNAETYCESVGGHLATLTSSAEWQAVRQMVVVASINYWIGLSDAQTEGTWRWVTGEAYSFSAWYTGQPDDYQSREDYVQTTQSGNGWNDNTATATCGFLCEFDSTDGPWVAGKYYTCRCIRRTAGQNSMTVSMS